MNIRTVLRRVGRVLFWVGVVIGALNIETLATALGYDAVLKNLIASQRRGVSKVTSFLVSDDAFHLALVAFGVGIAAYADLVFKKLELRRGSKPWWAGLHSFTVKDFSCLVAETHPDNFEASARAKAIAGEIKGYINSGHMPLMLESRVQPLRLQDYGGPQYACKQVGDDAQVLRSDLERLAIARKWKLPWEPQERKSPRMIPIRGGGNALRSLQGTESETPQ